MSNINNGSVCLNHPDVPAVGHCSVCRKPVCGKCAVYDSGVLFCSQECRASAIRTGAVFNATEDGKKRNEKRAAFRKFVIFVILVLLAAFGYWYYTNNKEQVQGFVEKGIEKTKEAASTVSDKVQEGLKKATADDTANAPKNEDVPEIE